MHVSTLQIDRITTENCISLLRVLCIIRIHLSIPNKLASALDLCFFQCIYEKYESLFSAIVCIINLYYLFRLENSGFIQEPRKRTRYELANKSSLELNSIAYSLVDYRRHKHTYNNYLILGYSKSGLIHHLHENNASNQ